MVVGKNPLIDEHSIDHELSEGEGNRRKRYREFVEERLRTKRATRGETDRRVIYGGEEFAGELKKMYEIDEMIEPVGRLKKSQHRK